MNKFILITSLILIVSNVAAPLDNIELKTKSEDEIRAIILDVLGFIPGERVTFDNFSEHVRGERSDISFDILTAPKFVLDEICQRFSISLSVWKVLQYDGIAADWGTQVAFPKEKGLCDDKVDWIILHGDFENMYRLDLYKMLRKIKDFQGVQSTQKNCSDFESLKKERCIEAFEYLSNQSGITLSAVNMWETIDGWTIISFFSDGTNKSIELFGTQFRYGDFKLTDIAIKDSSKFDGVY